MIWLDSLPDAVALALFVGVTAALRLVELGLEIAPCGGCDVCERLEGRGR
jgi:hypothetical protein